MNLLTPPLLLKSWPTNGTEDEYSDFWARGTSSIIEFDSYMIPSDELHVEIFRLLDVKVDAVPGRINMLRLMIQRPGVIFGQCSEICGANHRFIPIVLEAVNTNIFLN